MSIRDECKIQSSRYDRCRYYAHVEKMFFEITFYTEDKWNEIKKNPYRFPLPNNLEMGQLEIDFISCVLIVRFR